MVLASRRSVGLLAVLILFTTSGRELAVGAYAKVEASFQLPQVTGNPFDFTQNDVMVKIGEPNGASVALPAFYDGGTTWRVRYTPTLPGKYVVQGITLNGQDAHPQGLDPSDFEVTGPTKAGFVHIDPANNKRFIFDDGSPYYPVGYSLGWRAAGGGPLTKSLDRMGAAGVNWTRIWMCYWDGKNLDWANESQTQPALGYLMLPVAKTWDGIVDAADNNNVRFQFVLQHHGQYSTTADSNWGINPWNVARGGWLKRPEDFFTDPKAIALTKSKFRYIIARWGYSPSILAWEIFNEVEFTDGFRNKLDSVSSWLAMMAQFIREQDPYHHLVTVSSQVMEPKLWPAMDYYQSHTYPPDVVSAIAALDDAHLNRAYFYGEFGKYNDFNQKDGQALHRGLWASLMSQSSGAAEYWFWYVIEPNNLTFHYTAAQAFIHQSGLLDHQDLKPLEVTAQTPDIGPLKFASGVAWGPARSTEYTVDASGTVHDVGLLSAYLQGSEKNKAMFPYAVFHVDYPVDGTFSVAIAEITTDGAHLQVKVDDGLATTLGFAAAPPPFPGQGGGRPRPRMNPRPNATLEIPVSRGKHTIRIEDTGPDWVQIQEFELNPYAAELGVLAKGNADFVVLWAYNRVPAKDKPVSGTLRIPGLSDGSYQVSWLDTHSGKVISNQPLTVSGGEPATVTTPPIAEDAAAWIRKTP